MGRVANHVAAHTQRLHPRGSVFRRRTLPQGLCFTRVPFAVPVRRVVALRFRAECIGLLPCAVREGGVTALRATSSVTRPGCNYPFATFGVVVLVLVMFTHGSALPLPNQPDGVGVVRVLADLFGQRCQAREGDTIRLVSRFANKKKKSPSGSRLRRPTRAALEVTLGQPNTLSSCHGNLTAAARSN